MAKNTTTKNLGRLLEAALQLDTALETIEEMGERDGLAGLIGAPPEVVREASHDFRCDVLRDCADELCETFLKISEGSTPMGAARESIWAKVRTIHGLLGWPVDAIAYSLDVARDHLDDLAEPSAAPVDVKFPADPCPTRIDSESLIVKLICHGCPDEKIPGTEKDPRGFPGLLCETCAAEALLDLRRGAAELWPGYVYEFEEPVWIAVEGKECGNPLPGCAEVGCPLKREHDGICQWPSDARREARP
jgi:hypothetical protein